MPESNCKQYPSGVYKPTGILQKYGEPGKMYFGLLTGSYTKNTSGGVLRKPIGPITDEIDANTGQFTSTNGIVSTIDKLRIVGFSYSSNYEYNDNCGWITTEPLSEGKCRMWGNPIGEMMYEGLRYFAGKGSPTSDFTYGAGSNDDNDLGLPKPNWDDPYVTNDYCAKPFMLVLSDINPTYDSDQLPGSYFGSAPSPNDLSSLHVDNLADTIFSEEGLAGSYYIGQKGSTYDGSCAPKDATGFGDIRGICPEEPTKQGSYYAASIAYYGHNNDINPADTEQNVLSYIVGLASPLPRINIPVGDSTITLVPFAKSVGGCLGINGTEGQFQPTNTIVDFYVETITPTYGKFRINYEDVEQGADHDMDAIVEYEYQVSGSNVDISLTSTYASGCIIQHIGYIISGTTADGTYLEVRDYDTSSGSDPDYFLDTPPGQGPGGTWNDGVALPLSTTRSFTAGTTTAAALLENPLWYAAKWGGFNDLNENDKPDTEAEWDKDGDGIPDTYFYVVNPLKLEQQLNQSFADILSRGVSHVAPVVSVDEANRTQSGDEIYMAFFKPMPDDYWQGNLKKYGLDYLTRDDCNRTEPEWTIVDKNGDIAGECNGLFKSASTSYWSSSSDGGYVDRGGAGGMLKDSMPGSDPVAVPSTGPYYAFRNIYTYKGVSLEEFIPSNANILNSDLNAVDDTERHKIFNYIYGYTYDAESDGDPVAKRSWILGDIIHSEPRIIDYLDSDGELKYRFIAVGANDGMLHVFTDFECTLSAQTYPAGSEVFAFVPEDLLPRLKEFASPVHTYMVDGSSSLFRAQTKTSGYFDKTLIFGERRGGRSYWALDVTNPDPSNWTVKWHIQGGTGNFMELGYTWNKPYFAKIQTAASTYKDVVIFAGGYDPLEDLFPEEFEDIDEDGIRDSGESYSDTPGGTGGSYDIYNPDKDTMGRGIFIVDIADGSLLFSATYDSAELNTGTAQTYPDMKYCFPGDPTVIPLSESKLIIYAADIYGQIWKITYDYYESEQWQVKRIFQSNPGSDLATGDPDITGAALNSADTGRKTFYSPDVSYFGNCWTSKPVLYFGTGDRAHPRYAMISNRFYTVADHDALTDERNLLNLTCDELDENADSDGDGDVDDNDTARKQDLISKLSDESVCRGFFRVMDKQGDCPQCSISHVGEKILCQPTLFFKNVYFTAYQPVFDDPCNPNGNAFIYALDYCWGKSVFNYSEETGTEERNIEDTYQLIQNSSIPSGVRVITRGGHAAGLISSGGAVSGVGENLTTNIPGPPGGVSQILWETD